MIRPILALGILTLPLVASAETFKQIVNNQVVPLVDSLVALLYAIAFIFFLIGMLRFFFNRDEEERQKGKAFLLWSVVGLVVLFSVWSFVKILLSILPGTGA